MNQNKIITISRQYGSGGRIIGKTGGSPWDSLF